MDAKPRLDADPVQEFVGKSHADLDRVRGEQAAAVLAFLENRLRRSA